MLRKLLACWNFALLLIAFSQCDRCTTNPVEDITKWELVWDKAAAMGTALPSLDVERVIVCHVPSEEAVYVLEFTGRCCKFTQSSEGGLTCEYIANFPGITNQESFFAFPAGSIQEQSLYVGIVNGQTITLYRYKEKAWNLVKSYHRSSLSGQQMQSRSAACSIHEEGRLKGLILLETTSWPLREICYYDAAQETLTISSTWQYAEYNVPDTVIEIAPSTVLLNTRYGANLSILYWSERSNACERVSGQIYSHSERSNLFLLHVKKLMPQVVLANFVEKNGKTELQFSTMTYTHPHTMQPSNNLPEEGDEESENVDNRINHSQSLVLPFSEMVYVVTKDKYGQPVYYKGSFQEPAK